MPEDAGTGFETNRLKGGVRSALKHDSADLHVTGEARYVDDLPEPADCLHLYIATSEQAHAQIKDMDLSDVRHAPGVVAVLTAKDIPGTNDIGPVIPDDPLFVEDKVMYHGQSLFAVAAESRKAARYAAQKARINYEALSPLVTIEDARTAGSLIEAEQVMVLGDAEAAISQAPHSLSGRLTEGGQDHFYLEGQVAMAIPGENGEILVHSSTQNPTEAQHLIAKVLGVPDNLITVVVRRMGGGFGGKETQSALLAAAAALCASKTGRAVKFRLDRDDDMIVTGKRHDFEVGWQAGFDDNGRLHGAQFDLASRCGFSTDLSLAINDRAMFHADNCYFLGAARIVSNRMRTNTVSNTAFRGFGGPQGMIAVEHMMDAIAFKVGRDPLDVRLDNLYAAPERNLTPYHQTVEDFVARELMEDLGTSSDYRMRRKQIEDANKDAGTIKRGIALTPVKFGISFTTTHLNQAGALIHIYTDGSIQLNHGGTEMGQGLMVKVAQVVAQEFQVDIDRVRIMATSTEKVPNTSATAASSGSDLNGMAAKDAAEKIKKRLVDFLSEREGVPADDIVFSNNRIVAGRHVFTFNEVIKQAYLARISLSATGYYSTPKIHYDRATHRGRPFYYFAYGAAVSEVEIDTLTGENRVVRTDILHEVGQSLNPAVDMGQIEGGFVQGMGWLTTEELVYDSNGRLRTHAPSTYKIPTASDRPASMNIKIWDKGRNQERTIHRSKAVGEPPFMLAISVFSALTHAVSGATGHRVFPQLDAPATPERILMAVDAARAEAEKLA
ncbi:xanthine dehydrogenase molybdopterin binding subunit [Henriciella mobilis]|uniref:xanthine dehydrogenase molybdopterin binding subunit n=1 Tax=Henriciella mobilis TaxID=2305467 RepID=UPI000E65F348|nr:xanthine dehydrogenase molybdopterin binding subunit [Henriciella mobilis]RIJ16891.1 xanthine dehydrogenase molybdopterin binding subunit [Henriciella mobilis]RIJ19329.1 xanthine dehydrogenase molybdopterin binding subunit [Henriciella mobilis]